MKRALVFCLVLSGCAISKPIHQPGLVTSWDEQNPLPFVASPPIELSLHTRVMLYGNRPARGSLLTWDMERLTQGALKKTTAQFPFLAHAQAGLKEAPYRLVIEASHSRRGSETRLFLSALFFFIIPYEQELSLKLESSFYHGTTLVKTYQATAIHKDRLRFSALVGGLRYMVPNRTMEDTFRDLFLQIQQDAKELFGPNAAHA